MDGSRFDHIARKWATRRAALGGLLGGLLLPLLPEEDADARKKRQHNDRDKGRGKGHGRDKNARGKGRRGNDLRAEKKKKKKCKGGTIKCGKKLCVNASTNASNCGACGNVCGAGQACVGGVCQQPPSTGTCPAGQIRCGSGCVDPKSDEAHCGSCGVQCQGDLTCLNGTCACADAGDTKCGTLCVDSQTDSGNCGGCGLACTGGKRCLGGQCVDQPECVDQYGCGGYEYNDLKCVNGRCVCADPTEGICQRYPDRRGRCHVCCPGGSGQCLRDEVCHLSGDPSNYFAVCDCPTGWDRCTYGYPTGTCTEDWDRDPKKCGRFCNDCTYTNPKAICCGGGCIEGCRPGTFGSGCYPGDPCGPNCLPCGEGSICCNMGPGTAPRCIPNVTGYCYMN